MKQMTAQRGGNRLDARRMKRPLLALVMMLAAASVLAQQQSPEDAAVDTICQLPTISEGDKDRIAQWVQSQVTRLAQVPEAEGLQAANDFRNRFAARLADARCSEAFRTEFPNQAAVVGEKVLADSGTGRYVAFALARVLVEMNRPATVPALQACLKSPRPVARFLCARGLTEQKQAIASDKEKAEQMRRALREAGLAEQDPIVLAHIYRALALPTQAALVVEDYTQIMNRRLQDTRSSGFVADGAEIEAFAFFDSQGVLDALSASQKQDLVRPLAEFLRLYSARYNTDQLEFYEIDRLERLLHYTESLLDRLVDKDGGKIRDVLTSQGYAGRASVYAEAAKWIGDSESKTPGTLNGPPWNVPLGGSAQAEASARAPGSTE